jgi:hypothetical protein
MHHTRERLSVLWMFALLNYLYADVVALFAIAGSRNSFAPLSPWALMGSAILMEIPIAMILACRLLPFRANRLANIIAGGVPRDRSAASLQILFFLSCVLVLNPLGERLLGSQQMRSM